MSKSKRFTKKRENKNKKRDIERLRRQQQHQHQQQQDRGDGLVTTQPLIPDHMAQLISGGGEGGREGGDNSTKRTESETMPNTDVSDGTYSSFLITLWIILLYDSYSKFGFWIFNLFNSQQFL